MANGNLKGLYALCSSLLLLICINGHGQVAGRQKANSHNILLGAYYFDGWNKGSNHISGKLKNRYQDREPVWGWVTSTQPIVDAQIKAAADAGIGFFSFDWYFRNGSDNYPLNHALSLYLSSPERKKLQFCLMVANHNPYFVKPDNWEDVSEIWLKLFKQKGYLKVDGKPLLIFFETSSLVKEFGSAASVREAFARLKKASLKAGMKGVAIAACVYDGGSSISEAEACGFDILTGYNYHSNGLLKGQEVTPIDSMHTAEVSVWNGINRKSDLPYIPCITLNWDPRPWRPDTVIVPRFAGYSRSSVYKSVRAAQAWINENKQQTPKERMAIMYAWNENGEGGWLTPSKTAGDSLLLGVKQALKK